MLDDTIALLYLIISVMFVFNLSDLYKKFKEGNKKVSVYSLLATISLIVMFIGSALYFLFKVPQIILVSQIYMLGTMLFIKLRN
jgi:multisubunit Na+/H+ antiporter MnhG subunit